MSRNTQDACAEQQGYAEQQKENLLGAVRADRSSYYNEEFRISRLALDEAFSALTGARAVCGDIANISHAINMLRTARGNHSYYGGHSL